MPMPRQDPAVEQLEAEIGYHLQQHPQADQGEVKAVVSLWQHVLHYPLDGEEVDPLHRQVQGYLQESVAEEFCDQMI